MTRIYQRPEGAAPLEAQTRALVIGAGWYRFTKGNDPNVPVLTDLLSVGPSVREFVRHLIRTWGNELAAPLATVDLLVADASTPGWPALGVAGEVADGTKIDAPTLSNVKAALTAALDGADVKDHFLFLCCGHGFWKDQRCFVLSDFGADINNPWTSVVSLDDFALGLRQKKPRFQWLFFDCCSDMPADVLETLGEVGDPLIQPTKKGLAAAQQQFGPVSQFGLASSTIGTQAFGKPNEPSRFCEMLIDALNGSGAIERDRGVWWVDQYGIDRAVKSYVDRRPDLEDPDFYKFVVPLSSDSPARMLLPRLAYEPKSRLVAGSVPPIALKNAVVSIRRHGDTDPIWTQKPPGLRAKLHVDLPARWYYTVEANFEGVAKQLEVFATLPLAEPAEFIL